MHNSIRNASVIIISFRHKDLRAYFKTGTTQGICTDHAKRLGQILAMLDRAEDPEAVAKLATT